MSRAVSYLMEIFLTDSFALLRQSIAHNCAANPDVGEVSMWMLIVSQWVALVSTVSCALCVSAV